jgi:predicted metallo-beta-lactamase superfamily hydrolase
METEPICYLIVFALVWHTFYSEYKVVRDYYLKKKMSKLQEEADQRAVQIASKESFCNTVDMNDVFYCPCGKRMN